jgi:hypothetical protein
MADLVANVVPSSLDAILWTFASTGVGASVGLLSTHFFSQWMPLNPNASDLAQWMMSILSGTPCQACTPGGFFQIFTPKYPFGTLTLVELTSSIFAAGAIMRLLVPAAGESPIGDGTLMWFLLMTQPYIFLDTLGLLSKIYYWFFGDVGSNVQQMATQSPAAAAEKAEKMIVLGSATQAKEPKLVQSPLPPQLDSSSALPIPPSPYAFGQRHTAFVNFR